MTTVHSTDEFAGRPDATGTLTLDQLEVGRTGRVLAVGGDRGDLGRRLADRLGALGVLPGTAIRALRRAPLGDPVVYRVCDFDLCLRDAQAALVTVAVAVDRPATTTADAAS